MNYGRRFRSRRLLASLIAGTMLTRQPKVCLCNLQRTNKNDLFRTSRNANSKWNSSKLWPTVRRQLCTPIRQILSMYSTKLVKQMYSFRRAIKRVTSILPFWSRSKGRWWRWRGRREQRSTIGTSCWPHSTIFWITRWGCRIRPRTFRNRRYHKN